MTFEEIITEAAAARKAYQMREGAYTGRRYTISQIINNLPEEQRIAATKVLIGMTA